MQVICIICCALYISHTSVFFLSFVFFFSSSSSSFLIFFFKLFIVQWREVFRLPAQTQRVLKLADRDRHLISISIHKLAQIHDRYDNEKVALPFHCFQHTFGLLVRNCLRCLCHIFCAFCAAFLIDFLPGSMRVSCFYRDVYYVSHCKVLWANIFCKSCI